MTVNIFWGNGLMSSGNKPLPQPMVTKIYDKNKTEHNKAACVLYVNAGEMINWWAVSFTLTKSSTTVHNEFVSGLLWYLYFSKYWNYSNKIRWYRHVSRHRDVKPIIHCGFWSTTTVWNVPTIIWLNQVVDVSFHVNLVVLSSWHKIWDKCQSSPWNGNKLRPRTTWQ